MMNSHKTEKNLILGVMVLVSLAACGKNMSVRVAGKLAQKTAAAKDLAARGNGSGTDTSTNINVNVNNNDPSVDGNLDRWSVFDSNDLKDLPFLNKDNTDAGVRAIGFPAISMKDPSNAANTLEFVQSSNVVFRAVMQIPDKKWVKGVRKLKLVLSGLRRYNAPSETYSDLSKQVLCIMDGKVCSGDKAQTSPDKDNLNPNFWASLDPVNTVFSKTPLRKTVAKLDDGSTLIGLDQDPIEFDLRDLFEITTGQGKAVTELSAQEAGDVIDWLMAHSTAYGDPNYRKFRFVMGNNVYADSGSLQIDFDYNDQKPAQWADYPTTLTNQDLDKQLPSFTSASSVSTPMTKQTDSTSGTGTDSGAAVKQPDEKPAEEKRVEEKPAPVITPIVGSVAPMVNPAIKLTADHEAALAKALGFTLTGKIEANSINHPLKESDFVLELDKPSLTFNSGEMNLTIASQKRRLERIAKIMKSFSAQIDHVRILGQADQQPVKNPKSPSNQALSEGRANAVATLIAQSGITPQASGAGPVATSSCQGNPNCPADRRVDIGIYFKANLENKDVVRASLRAAVLAVWYDHARKSSNRPHGVRHPVIHRN